MPQPSKPQRRPFHSTCVGWPDDIRVLEHLISEGRKIERAEFLTLVNLQAMKRLERGLGYGREGLNMAEDYHVAYFVDPESLVPFFVHSAIEHVFATPSDIDGIRARLDPPRVTAQDVSDWVMMLVEEEEDVNEHLHVMNGNGHVYDAEQLVVITHPGDAFDEYGIFEALDAASWEIRAAALGGAGLIFIDRFSSSYMEPGERFGPWDDWFDTCRDLTDQAAHIYADHLDQAAEHIAKYATNAKSILVTGLWSDEKHGCARALQEELVKRGAPARLSEHSPDMTLRREPGEEPSW